MLAGWLTAVLLVACSAVIGRAITRLAGDAGWNGLEPAAGFAVIVVVQGVLARISADRSVLLLGMLTLLMLAAAVLRQPERSDLPVPGTGLPVTLGAVFVLLNIPFMAAGQWGVPGGSDVGLFLSMLSGESGAATATGAEAIGGLLGPSPFTGLMMAVVLVTAWTAWEAVDRLAGWKRPLAAVLVAMPYLLVSAYASAAFTQLATALFLLAFLVALDRTVTARRTGLRPGTVLVPVLLTAGTIGALTCFEGLQSLAAGGLTGSVSPIAGLGIWFNADYRLDTADAAPLPGLFAAISGLSLILALWWWSREPRSVWPLATPVLAGAWLIAYLAGGDLPVQILAVGSPVITTVILVALLTGPRGGWKPQQGMEFGGWVSLAALFVIGSLASGLLVLRDLPVIPAGTAVKSRSSGGGVIPPVGGSAAATAGNSPSTDLADHQGDHGDNVDLPDQSLGRGQ